MLIVPFQLAKAEKLKPMELELRKLEDLAESVVNDFAYMRAREEEMRDTNGGWLVFLLVYSTAGSSGPRKRHHFSCYLP